MDRDVVTPLCRQREVWKGGRLKYLAAKVAASWFLHLCLQNTFSQLLPKRPETAPSIMPPPIPADLARPPNKPTADLAPGCLSSLHWPPAAAPRAAGETAQAPAAAAASWRLLPAMAAAWEPAQRSGGDRLPAAAILQGGWRRCKQQCR